MRDPSPASIPRREFLRTGAIAAVATGAGAAASGANPGAASGVSAPPDPRRTVAAAVDSSHRTARNVIFLVADGASTGTITLADLALRRRRGESSWWCRLWATPGAHRAAVRTGAADSLVTDSAAGASAWGIGSKVNNGAVNVLPDGSTPIPLLVRARAAGRATGLVTTTRVTDATPAGFIANVPRRTLETVVAEQIIDRGVDVVIGGGRRSFSKEVLADERFEHAHDGASLRAALGRLRADPDRRLLGLLSSGSMPYELDRPESLPTLAEMTALALRRLTGIDQSRAGSTGFVLQVEGGRVDHAAHDNDAAAMVADQIAFDDAVGIALDFAAARDDTLVIVTTDHGNANPGLTLYGPAGDEGLRRLLEARRSFDWIKTRLKEATRHDAEILAAEARNAPRHAAARPGLPEGGGADGDIVRSPSVVPASLTDEDPASIAEGVFERAPSDLPSEPDHGVLLAALVREAMGVALAPEETAWVLRRLAGSEPVNGFTEADTPEAALGSVLANHFAVSFMSTNHTADLVDAVAIGPGAERFAPLMENTDLHGILVDALGLPA